MHALADLLAPQASRTPVALAPRDAAVLHLAQPKRRSLVRTIGYGELSEKRLRMAYGPSWGAVQADLRELLRAGLVLRRESGRRVSYSLDLSAFPLAMTQSLFGRTTATAVERRMAA